MLAASIAPARRSIGLKFAAQSIARFARRRYAARR
jgi:hypothetical protein